MERRTIRCPNGRPRIFVNLDGTTGNIGTRLRLIEDVMREDSWSEDDILEFKKEALNGGFLHFEEVIARYLI